MPRGRAINWEQLGYSPHNLDDLDTPFTEEELLNTIRELPPEKASGPDGFIGVFYKKCWEIIKDNLYAAILGFYNHRNAKMSLFNEANIVLLPKKQDARTLNEYRPISLTNSMVKNLKSSLRCWRTDWRHT